MNKHALTLAGVAAAAAFVSGSALAQPAGEGPWMVRVRATNLVTDTSSTAGLGGALPADAIDVNNKWIPEVDVSYFFTPNFAAELILTYPQKHDVRLNGGKIGSVKHLPPTLLAQYHFTGLGAFKPYVGAGINYTRFSGVDIAGGALTVKKNSWGPALQLGFDYALDKHWSLNLDVKKVYIDTTVSGGVGRFKVDPVLVGLGVGYRF